MKKIIAFILCFAFIIGLYPTAFAAESVSADKANIELLNLINVVDKKEFSDTELAENVTRANFLVYVGRLLSVKEQPDVEEEYFTDLENHWSKKLVSYFVNTGVISVGDDRMFNPDRAITVEEAAKILVSILGYDVIAKEDGGYPTGYMKIAHRLGIVSGSVSETPTLAEVFDMLSLSCEVACYEPIIIKDDTIRYEPNDEATLLSIYHSIDSYEGYVRSVGTVSLDDADGGDGCAVIGQERYEIDDSISYPEQYIGYYVKVFFTETSDGIKTAKLCIIIDNDRIKEINADDIDSIDSSYNLRYFKNDNGDAASLKLDRGIKLLYNGVVKTDNISSTITTVKNGSIRLIDADENGCYEYGVIKDYIDFVVSWYDSEGGSLFDKLNGSEIKFDDYEYVGIYDKEYTPVDASMLKENTVLSVAASTDNSSYMEIITSNNSAYGVIDQMWTNDDKTTVKIGDAYYEVSSEYLKKNKISVGMQGTFFINAFNEITFVDVSSSDKYHYGYLCRGIVTNDVFSETVLIEIFGEDSILKRQDITENTIIDGVRCKKASEITAALSSNSKGEITNQLIRYRTDAEGNITHIDTQKKSIYENSADSLVATEAIDDSSSSSSVQRIFSMSGNVKRIGTNVIFDTDTILFYVPEESAIRQGDYTKNDFSIASFSDMVIDTGVNAVGYKSSLQSVCEDAVVCYGKGGEGEPYNSNTNLFIVEEIRTSLDEDGIIAWDIHGIRGSAAANYLVSDEYESTFEQMDIAEGDLLAIGTDSSGKINDIRMLYDLSQGGEPYNQKNSLWYDSNRYVENYNNFSQLFSCSFMYAGYKDGNVIKGFYNKDADFLEKSDEAVDATNVKVVVVDDERREGYKVYVGSTNDIKDAFSVGAQNCSKIFVHYRYVTVKDIVVYK